MTDDERDEWEAMLAEAHGDPANGGKATKAMAARLADALRDAEQAGRRWAAHVLDDATADGLHGLLKKALKRQSVVLVSHDGRLVGKASRVGVRRAAADGTRQWQQALIHDLTWDELAEWLDGISDLISSLLVNRTMAERLLALRERHPDTVGPAEACARLGTTVTEFLAEAAS
jgi:hypothetical protein